MPPTFERPVIRAAVCTRDGLPQASPPSRPLHALISYAYWEQWKEVRDLGVIDRLISDYSLDSGAFTAHSTGKEIRLEKFAAFAGMLMATDPKLVEIFSLDVIGDWRATARNTEWLWRRGIPAIPTFHADPPDPFELLKPMAADYPKIALAPGARRPRSVKVKWLNRCFEAIWPKRIHGLGCGFSFLDDFPFESVDSSTWEFKARAFGNWTKYGNLGIRGSKHNLTSELELILGKESWAQERWRGAMAQLPEPEPLLAIA